MPRQRTQCPACECDDTQEEIRLPYDAGYFDELRGRYTTITGEHYILRRCERCDFRFQQSVLTPEEDSDLNEVYWGEEIDTRPMSARELAHMTEDILIVRQLFPDVTPCVLDYGVGKANWAGIAKGFQCEAWGTDTAKLCEEYCRHRGVTWTPLDAIPENKFHFINSDSVFEHISDPLKTLRQLRDALVPGGILKLNVPAKRDFKKTFAAAQRSGVESRETLDKFLKYIEPLVHINLFTPANLINMGLVAGLSRYRVPLGLSYSSMILFNSGRQWNRNLYKPFKRWLSNGTWQFFRRPLEA